MKRGAVMQGDAIAAYDVDQRIATYDADMDIMHPNRHKMIQVALEILPHDRNEAMYVLEIGVGTGFFTKQLLEAYPNARVIAIDGAPTMVKVAEQRLGPAKERVEFRVGDFRDLDSMLVPGDRGQLVISSYALHHLDSVAKADVVRRCVDFLKPGGWFVNADCIVGSTDRMEQRYQELRVAGVVRRADASDPRFGDPARARKFLDDLEETEGDQPLPLAQDLEILRAAGLKDVDAYWLEHREAVTGGVKRRS